MKRKTIQLLDTNISYVEKNVHSDQVIICLHALGHSSKDYEKIFFDYRFDKFRIIAVDFPGHGQSTKGEKSVSSEYYAELLQRFITELDLKNIILLGNSIGGGVGIRLAANKSNNIQLLQLANSAGLDKGGIVGKYFLKFMVYFFNLGVKKSKRFPKYFRYYYNKVLTENEAHQRREEIIKEGYEIAPLLVEGWQSFSFQSEDLRPLAEKVECPTLVTFAMKDRKVQYKRNIAGIKKFQNLTLIKYQAGHTPILENPKVFLDDLFGFINANLLYTA